MAKNLNILDPDALADIVCSRSCHIGLSQIPLGLARAHYSAARKEKSLFKHMILGHHLIKKSQLNISDRRKENSLSIMKEKWRRLSIYEV